MQYNSMERIVPPSEQCTDDVLLFLSLLLSPSELIGSISGQVKSHSWTTDKSMNCVKALTLVIEHSTLPETPGMFTRHLNRISHLFVTMPRLLEVVASHSHICSSQPSHFRISRLLLHLRGSFAFLNFESWIELSTAAFPEHSRSVKAVMSSGPRSHVFWPAVEESAWPIALAAPRLCECCAR